MDPVTGAIIIGGAINAASSFFGGKAKKKAAKQQAKLLEQQAQRLLDLNAENRAKVGVQGAEAAAQQLTGFSKAGVDIGSGSALEVLMDTQTQVLANQYVSARGAEFEAQNIRTNAQTTRIVGDEAERQGTFAAVGALFGTAGKAGAR